MCIFYSMLRRKIPRGPLILPTHARPVFPRPIQPQPQEKPAGSALGSAQAIIKELSAYTAIVYVLGFLAVRSRLAVLGVWSGLSVADARYLQEGGVFALYTLERLLFPWGFILFCVAALVALILRALKLPPSWFSKKLPSWLSLLLFSLSVVALTKAIQGQFGDTSRFLGVLVPRASEGSLNRELLSQLAATDVGRYDAEVLLAALAFVAWRWSAGFGALPAAPAWLQTYCVLLLATVGLMLPIHYGIWVSSREYPLAKLTASENLKLTEPLFILLETDGRLIVQEPAGKNRPPRLVNLKRDDVSAIEVQRYTNVFASQDAP